MNQSVEKTYPDSTTAAYTYDLVGKILQVNDPTGTYAFAYDNMGRLIGTTTTYSFLPNTPFSNSYSYDADSNRTGFTAPDGSTDTYSYDTLNRLSTLANSWAGSFGFSYDALSRRTQMTRPNNITTNYTYDTLSRLLSVLHQAGGSTIDGEAYTLDAAGNRTAKQDDLAGVTSNFSYDKIYELTQVTQGTNTTESYSYDAVGNRLSSLGVSPYSYNTSNELTSTPSGSYTYDANGNTLTDAAGRGYTWDFENRLTQVTLPNSGGTVTFLYDPFGRRIQKVYTTGANPPTTTTTNYLYDGDNVIETVDQNGNSLSRFAQGQNIDEPLAESVGGATYDYEQDGLGSVSSLTNSTGALSLTYTYDSFGKITNSQGSVSNPFRYTGRDFDSETGLYYYRARYYDSTAGRFLSEDPAGFFEGFDFYTYVGGDPNNLADPSGLAPCGPCAVPQHPSSADPYQNMWQAQQNGYLWWYRMVSTVRGTWDYKWYNHLWHPEYDNFGNFNFGATGCAMGIPLNILLRGAGWAKSRQFSGKGASDPYGRPLGRYPYGNQPDKQQQIINGFNFCKKCMPPDNGFGGQGGQSSGPTGSSGGGGGFPF